MFNAIVIALLAVFVGMLLRASWRQNRKGQFLFKPLASLMFLLLAAGNVARFGPFELLFLGGLVFGAAGDVALMFKTKRWFLVGLVLFLIGHLGYAAGFMLKLETFTPNWPVVGLFCAVTAWGLWAMDLRFGKLFIPAMAYMVTIVAMVVLAWHYHLSFGLVRLQPLLMAWGATLFFVSDFFVAREAFAVKTTWNRTFGLPLYYAGQAIIAISLGMP